MKKSAIILVFVLSTLFANAQQNIIDSLRHELSTAQSDTAKFSILDSLAIYYLYFTTKQDSAFVYINETINNAFPLDDKSHLILGYARMGLYFDFTANYKSALAISLKGVKLSQQYNIPYYLSALYYNIAFLYIPFRNFDTELKYAYEGELYLKDSKDPYFDQRVNIFTTIGDAYVEKKIYDSAFYYFKKAHSIALHSKDATAKDVSLWYLGEYYLYIKNYAKADSIFSAGTIQCKKNNDYSWLESYPYFLAKSLIEQNKIHEAIPIAHSAMIDAQAINDKSITSLSAKLLYNCYDKLGLQDSALHYLKLSDSINSTILSSDINNQIQEISFTEQLNKKEEQANQILENEKNRNKIITYVFFTALGFFLLIVAIQWRNNSQRKKTNTLLQQQKQEIQNTLTDLKSTQSQLIQSEKMASLGELTAGIAHEIQNPLNFVNNFSEVNKELLAEMKDEMDKGNMDDAKEIANDVIGNEEKINHHGKRADAIVKGMLQHSRSSSGVKEPTDINVLADEYLRLAYHGLRAKDKSFNATMKTDFDETFGKINIIPQDIGRVLLNLFNNAFYSINEKKKNIDEGYEPTISVSTKRINDKVEIRVKDNGGGIPQQVLDKIYQPFFTTKPTGQGTGLGLSLSYDIIKAHGGEIKLNTKEGEGAEFIIELPI